MKCQATRPAWEGGDRRGRQGAEPHFPLGLRWGMGPLLKRHKIHTAEAVFLSSILVRGARYPHSPNQSGGDDSLGLITTRDFQSLPPFGGSVDGAAQSMILLFNPRWRDCIINFLFSSVVFGLVRMN